MIDPNKKEALPVNPSDVCYQAFRLMKAKQYVDAEKLLSNNLSHTEDKMATALYHSTLGVLFKLKGDFKEAWRHYERAEKLIPEDPALKIIVARLLIEQFSQYDDAIKRAKKVLKLLPANPVFVHQAFVTMGLAYAGKGKKREAMACLESSIVEEFKGFVTAKNIDFHLVEVLLRKGWGVETGRQFLNKALSFATNRKEQLYIDSFSKMLRVFDQEYK